MNWDATFFSQRVGSNRISSIDSVRILAAVGVVFIHYSFPGRIGIAVESVARFAVPFFFMVAGYFLLSTSVPFDIKRLVEKILRFIKLYIWGGFCIFL